VWQVMEAFVVFLRTARAIALLGASGAVGGEPVFLVLGEDLTPREVSADGAVVTGHASFGFGSGGAFRWTEEGIEILEPPPGSFNIVTDPFGLSADGRVIVGIHNAGPGPEAFRWTEETGMVLLGDFPGGPFESRATATSGDGAVVVGFGSTDTSEDHEAFRWTLASQQFEGLGFLDADTGVFSVAEDVTPDGDVVVGRSRSRQGQEAFRWTRETGMVGLGSLPSPFFRSSARAVSADGSVVVGWAFGEEGQEAFRWTAETGMVELGDLPGPPFQSVAHDVSGDGSIVVGEGGAADTDDAFIWTEAHGMRRLSEALEQDYGLDLGGWTLAVAWAISLDGRTIVGSAYPAEGGEDQAFIVYLGDPPCPADLDGDGAVGLLDLNTLLLNFGRIAGAQPEQGDLDRDGDIDVSDLAALLSAFGEACE